MTRGDIKTEVLVRSGKDTTSAWTSEAFINDWINQAHRWAAGYKPWPYTEGRTSTTYSTASEEWDFEGYRADSFRLLQIGGKRLRKLNFEDYQIFKEEESSADDRVFSDFGGLVFVNTKVDASGTLTAWGQYMPATIPDGDGATADDLETVFSEGGDEGNQAVIEETLSYIANRENKRDIANNHHGLAKQLLDELWKRIQDEQYGYQTHPARQGMYQRFDVLRGAQTDELIRRDQF